MNAVFDTTFLKHDDGPSRARYGELWTDAELDRLRKLFLGTRSLKSICDGLDRPASGVLSKLCTSLGLLAYDGVQHRYRYTDKAVRALFALNSQPQPQPQPQPEKETTMKTITITNQTLVNGRNVKDMPDSELFSLIADEEARIEELSKIKAQPKRLKDEIAKRQQAVLDLVALLDKEA